MSIASQEKVADFINNARQIVTEAVDRVKMPTPMRLRDLVSVEKLKNTCSLVNNQFPHC